MNVTALSIPEVKIITPDVLKDHRGHLAVPFSVNEYEALGISFNLRQINQGYSKKIYTIRGMHYQKGTHAQAKLISACNGTFFSVAVDIRRDSPYFGKWCGEVISFENQCVMYVPRGFAHGYLTLEADTLLQYCVDNDFCAEAAKSLRFDDETVGIDWMCAPDLSTLTKKDLEADYLEQV